ncbi:hypothetical protein DAEQUDRAFT_458698 [Daedalea quercina L-15889]|uniref:Uncharacterized protein n=1 Tax=Daedalea quercina L-15889 TaxID=1314783 RepID=A0A165TC02_9APHY|nr:hypothetical protein DAEQUDRAFT_458698 [Daedalea quercina L-15889]
MLSRSRPFSRALTLSLSRSHSSRALALTPRVLLLSPLACSCSHYSRALALALLLLLLLLLSYSRSRSRSHSSRALSLSLSYSRSIFPAYSHPFASSRTPARTMAPKRKLKFLPNRPQRSLPTAQVPHTPAALVPPTTPATTTLSRHASVRPIPPGQPSVPTVHAQAVLSAPGPPATTTRLRPAPSGPTPTVSPRPSKRTAPALCTSLNRPSSSTSASTRLNATASFTAPATTSDVSSFVSTAPVPIPIPNRAAATAPLRASPRSIASTVAVPSSAGSSLPALHPLSGPSSAVATAATAASSAAAAAPGPSTIKTRRTRKGLPVRDLTAQLNEEFGSAEGLRSRLDEFDKIWQRPVMPATQVAYDRVARLWFSYFKFLYGSEEKAQAVIRPGAPFPPLKEVIPGLRTIFKSGTSRLEGSKKGWSQRTAIGFIGILSGYLRSIGAQPPEKHERVQMKNAVYTFAKEGIVSTKKREKLYLRCIDLIDLGRMALDSKTPLHSPLLRIQAIALGNLLYATGQRPAAIVLGRGYENTDQCLRFEHVEPWITGWKPGEGLEITLFIKFEYMKFMRAQEGHYMRTSLRSLCGDNAVCDFVPVFMALALAREVFQDPVAILDMYKDPSKLPDTLPHLLTYKPECRKLPVFVGEDRESAATISMAHHWLVKIARLLDWSWFCMRCLRYSFARDMVPRLSKLDLNHILGHNFTSILSKSTYQTADHHVDIAARRFNEPDSATHLDLTDFHASVAFRHQGAEDVPPPVQDDSCDKPVADEELLHRIAVWRRAEEALAPVHNGKLIFELEEEDLKTSEQREVLDKWLDVITYYSSLRARVRQR